MFMITKLLYKAFIESFSNPCSGDYAIWTISWLFTIPADIISLPFQILGIIIRKIDLWRRTSHDR